MINLTSEQWTNVNHGSEKEIGFEYRTTEGPRKHFDEDIPPEGEGWVKNIHKGRKGWNRFDYTEEAYWMRTKTVQIEDNEKEIKVSNPYEEISKLHQIVEAICGKMKLMERSILKLTKDLADKETNECLQIIHSAKSSVGLDMEAIAAQVPLPMVKTEEQIAFRNHFVGRSSLFARFLSPTIVNSGRGFIKPVDGFKQYEEDITSVDLSNLLEWPSGFYRNRETKEPQLFISGPSIMVIMAINTASNVKPIIYTEYEDCFYNKVDIDTCEFGVLIDIYEKLEKEFIEITKDYF